MVGAVVVRGLLVVGLAVVPLAGLVENGAAVVVVVGSGAREVGRLVIGVGVVEKRMSGVTILGMTLFCGVLARAIM